MSKGGGPEQTDGHTRRSFLKKFSLGIATLAGAGILLRNFAFSGGNEEPESGPEFPGEDSIFHPRRDPRPEALERSEKT